MPERRELQSVFSICTPHDKAHPSWVWMNAQSSEVSLRHFGKLSLGYWTGARGHQELEEKELDKKLYFRKRFKCERPDTTDYLQKDQLLKSHACRRWQSWHGSWHCCCQRNLTHSQTNCGPQAGAFDYKSWPRAPFRLWEQTF